MYGISISQKCVRNFLPWKHTILVGIIAQIISCYGLNFPENSTDGMTIFKTIPPDLKKFSTNFNEDVPVLVESFTVINTARTSDTSFLLPIYFSEKKNYKLLSDSHRENIQNLFKKMERDLMAIRNLFNSNKVSVTKPVANRPKCIISKGQLKNIEIETAKILSNNTSDKSKKLRCEVDLSNTDNCNELMTVIQCALDHVKNGLVEELLENKDSLTGITNWKHNFYTLNNVIQDGLNYIKNGLLEALIENRSSHNETEKWQNAYQQLLVRYEKETEELKQALSEDYDLKLNKLQKIMQELEKLLNDVLGTLEIKKGGLSVIEIILGMIPDAVNHFKDLQTTSISEVIKLAYNYKKYSDYNDMKRFFNMIEFIRLQPKLSNDLFAFTTLISEMKSKNHVNTDRILMLDYAIDNSPAMNLAELKMNIRGFLHEKIENFADDLRLTKKNTENYEFQYIYYNYYNSYLEEIIKKATKYTPNETIPDITTLLGNIIAGVRNFPYINQGILGFSYIFDFMRKQKLLGDARIMNIGYNIKYYMNMNGYLTLPSDIRGKFEKLKSKLPKGVKEVIWHGDACKLKNKYYGQYMYSDGKIPYDSERRNVFLWRFPTAPEGTMVPESQWKFETVNDGNTFRIKNVRYNEYMYCTVFDFTPGRRYVFTWIPKEAAGPQGDWEIIPDSNNGSYIYLKSKHFNEVFYSDGAYPEDELRQRIFTWGNGFPRGVKWEESQWDIQCS